ncbi:IS3 family transposase IS1296 [Mycoplasma feriruminatoris]|uniref:IS3 family transposase IS1296 n=1 Tax=Mycoplasma feriruminatoris TaxID=1179777 RepID=A0AAX3TGD3_9MOLU|nr:IS3 family transposase IS1296 [Mycoplasma feriruminatoris]
MAKWSLEKKLKIVKEAKRLNVKNSTYLADRHNVSANTLKGWIYKYEMFGIEALTHKKTKPHYSLEAKQEIVLYKLKTKESYRKLQKFNIIHSSTIAGWVKKYKENGILGLNNNIGRPKKIMKNSKKKPVKKKKTKITTNNEDRIKQLEEEVEYYKLEVEFWKKLNTLLTEEESTRKKQK